MKMTKTRRKASERQEIEGRWAHAPALRAVPGLSTPTATADVAAQGTGTPAAAAQQLAVRRAGHEAGRQQLLSFSLEL